MSPGTAGRSASPTGTEGGALRNPSRSLGTGHPDHRAGILIAPLPWHTECRVSWLIIATQVRNTNIQHAEEGLQALLVTAGELLFPDVFATLLSFSLTSRDPPTNPGTICVFYVIPSLLGFDLLSISPSLSLSFSFSLNSSILIFVTTSSISPLRFPATGHGQNGLSLSAVPKRHQSPPRNRSGLRRQEKVGGGMTLLTGSCSP